ncbi:YagK/YfjJ domain-containing protein [Vreelandella populi]|nr:inovirus-type Gp2 protein [Halomonas populi]
MNLIIPNVGQRRRKRHQDNPALKLFWEFEYHNMMVQTQKGPLIENYLETLLRVMNQARQDCSRLFAVRIDLRFPAEDYTGYIGLDNAYIRKFLDFLQWELNIAGNTKPHKMRYVWCLEQATSSHHHYHLLLLLNGNAYRYLGDMKKSPDGFYSYDNLYHRLVRAWAFAINWPQECMDLLARVPEKHYKTLATWEFKDDDQTTFADLFYAASYLCKAYSKPIGQGVHCFDGSQL